MEPATNKPLSGSCPYCGHVLKIKQELIGKRVKCSKCDSVLACSESGELLADNSVEDIVYARSDVVLASISITVLTLFLLGITIYFGIAQRLFGWVRGWGWDVWAVGIFFMVIVPGGFAAYQFAERWGWIRDPYEDWTDEQKEWIESHHHRD